jgi:uroporphyrinogen-III synthase
LPEPGRRHVLITRPEPDASETAQRVAALGWEPVIAPVLRIVPGLVCCQTRFDAILVTSRNAIPALPDWYRPTLVLAVGRATAARARAAGFARVVDADGEAADLIRLAAEVLPDRARVLVLHAHAQGDELVAKLGRCGFRVHRRSAYQVLPVTRFPPPAADALRRETVAAAIFLSAETARAFVRLLPAVLAAGLGQVDALAIGAAAADVLAPLPWRRVRVSLRPTLEHVLALL